MSLAGKNMIVTGASRGVGRAIAMACAKEGATVLLIARDQDALENVENEIKENGGQAASYAVDLTVEAQGHIVNISSNQAFHPIGNASAYCASKAAMEAFTKSLYMEAKPHNIKATSVAPSTVDTEFREQMTNRKSFSQDEKDKMLRPHDVADAVVGVLTSSPTSVPSSIVLDMHQQ